jgi:hypothetical protein
MVMSIDGCLNNAADFSTWQQVKKSSIERTTKLGQPVGQKRSSPWVCAMSAANRLIVAMQIPIRKRRHGRGADHPRGVRAGGVCRSTSRRRGRGSETRRRSCSHQEDALTPADLFFSNPRTKRSGWGGWPHPENTAHGLRDFSPGASVISAMRPPFSATQEFFVSGYLSV